MLTNESTPAERYSAIVDALAAGQTVYLATPARVTPITPKTAAQWTASGRPVVKLSADGARLLLASGRQYVDASYCSIVIR